LQHGRCTMNAQADSVPRPHEETWLSAGFATLILGAATVLTFFILSRYCGVDKDLSLHVAALVVAFTPLVNRLVVPRRPAATALR